MVLAFASAAAAITPNDPVWPNSWGEQRVGMAGAWDITKGDPNVIIAVVDTGVNPNAADLHDALVPGWDFINNTYTSQDLGGHGTLSATIAVGRGNDGQGVAGYCWRCKVMPVRVSASGSQFDSGLAALGIRWAVDHGARIISIGFSDEGTYTIPEPHIASAIAYAAQHNVLVLASSGNTGDSTFTHPAADPGAYAVAGTDPSDALFSWSTRGSWVGLAAPGCQWGYWSGKGYMNACGSSTAAPAMAGIAGLMLSVNPSLTPARIVAAIRQTAVRVTGINYGRVNAYQALIAVGGKPPPPPPPPPPAAAAGQGAAAQAAAEWQANHHALAEGLSADALARRDQGEEGRSRRHPALAEGQVVHAQHEVRRRPLVQRQAQAERRLALRAGADRPLRSGRLVPGAQAEALRAPAARGLHALGGLDETPAVPPEHAARHRLRPGCAVAPVASGDSRTRSVCVLASERPSRSGDERRSAKPSWPYAERSTGRSESPWSNRYRAACVRFETPSLR